MLILTRKISETILIDEDKIEVKILGINGAQVRIGVDAPRDISVHREEVFERIKSGQKPNKNDALRERMKAQRLPTDDLDGGHDE